MTDCTTAAAFAAACEAWLTEEVEAAAVVAAKQAAQQIYANLVVLAPVWTGRFLASVNISVGQPDGAVLPEPDHPRQERNLYLPLRPDEIDALLAEMRLGDTAYLADGAPYGQRLDDGYSQQAPAGFWELAVELAVNDLAGADVTKTSL